MVRASLSDSDEDSESSDCEQLENGDQGCRENDDLGCRENGVGHDQDTENRSSEEAEEKEYCVEDFDFGVMIGSGRFGKVYVAHEKKSKMKVAIKVINKASISKDMEAQVFHELAIHSIFHHPYIIPVYTCFHNDQSIFTVMEYASSNSLHSVMRAQKFKRYKLTTFPFQTFHSKAN